MMKILAKFYLIPFLLYFLNLLIYCHGMQQEKQKYDAKQKKPLNAAATPFVPKSKASTTTLPGNTELDESPFVQSSTALAAQLPGKPFEEAFGEDLAMVKEERVAVEKSAQMEMFLKQQRQNGTNTTTRHSYDLFGESANSSRTQNILKSCRKIRKQKWKKLRESSRKEWKRQNRGKIEQNLPDRITKEAVINLGESKDKSPSASSHSKDESEEGSSSDRLKNDIVQSKEASVKSGDFKEPIYGHEKFESPSVGKTHQKQIEIPGKERSKPKSIGKVWRKKEEGSPPRDSGAAKQGVSYSPKKTAEKQGISQSYPYRSTPQTSTGGSTVKRGGKKEGKGTVVITESTNRFGALESAEEEEEESKGDGLTVKSNQSFDTAAVVPVSPRSSSGASGSKGKAVVSDEKFENDYIYFSRINSIVASVKKLNDDKNECMRSIAEDEHKKEEKLKELMKTYADILNTLEQFSAIYYYSSKHKIVYIGHIFDVMNATCKEPVSDHNFLRRTMLDNLAYLDENLRSDDVSVMGFENFFEKMDNLEKHIASYDKPVTEGAKANKLIEWYMQNVEKEVEIVFSYLFVFLDENAQFTRNVLYMGLTILSDALLSRRENFLEARRILDEYMEMVEERKEGNLEKSKIDIAVEYLVKSIATTSAPVAAIPINLPSSSGASGSKGKAVMKDKIESEDFDETFYSMVNSIVVSVDKLDKNKGKCDIKQKKEKKEHKVIKLMNDYQEIMRNLEKFTGIYDRHNKETKEMKYIYIGDMFDWINQFRQSDKSTISLIRIMQETLAYLDENLKNSEEDALDLDNIFKNLDLLKDFIQTYNKAVQSFGKEDPQTEKALSEMIKFYKETIELDLRHLFHFLFLGLHSNDVNAKVVGLSEDVINTGLAKLSLALPKRRYLLMPANMTVINYLIIVANESKGIQLRDAEKQIQGKIEKINKDIEFLLDKIAFLDQELANYFKTEVPEIKLKMKLKMRLKINYQIIMDLLTRFVGDYGKNRQNASDFFEDIIQWIVTLYTGEQEIVSANDLNKTMRSSLSVLQGNEDEEDMTNFGMLLQNIARLKMESDECDKLAKSSKRGYRVQTASNALQKLSDFFNNNVTSQLIKAFSFVIIGMNGEKINELTADKIIIGLDALKSILVPKYENKFDEFFKVINEFNIFMQKARAQLNRENLVEIVAKILDIPFDSKDEERNFEKFADKIQYSTIYTESLASIYELLEQMEQTTEKEKMPSCTSSTTGISTAASSKKGRNKADGKKKKSAPLPDFGPVNESNWIEVLIEAKKLIHYMDILLQIEDAWSKPEQELVFEKAAYKRTWTILFRYELLPLMNKWKITYYSVKKNDSVKDEARERSAIITFFANGIAKFAAHKSNANKVKGNRIRDALELLSQMQIKKDMWHRFKHFRKLLDPTVKLDAKLICNCAKYGRCD